MAYILLLDAGKIWWALLLENLFTFLTANEHLVLFTWREGLSMRDRVVKVELIRPTA